MEAIDRLALFNTEAEESVIGSIFLEPELIKDCGLEATEFSPGPNYKMFATLLDLDKKGLPIDPVSVADRLGKALNQVGGISRILELSSSVPSTRNFKRHCAIVREHYQVRQAVALSEKLQKGALEGDIVQTLSDIQKGIENVLDSNTNTIDGSIKQGLVKLVEKLEAADGKTNGIYPGFKDLSRIVIAYLKGQFVVTGARPSVGKTAFMVNSALNIAGSTINPNGDVVGIISLETYQLSILERFAASIGNLDLNRMKTAAKDFTAEEWTKFYQSIGVLGQMDLEIFDKPRVDTNYIRACIKETKKKYEKETPGRNYLFFIDYLQLIEGDPKLDGNRTLQLSKITRDLKVMAGELGVTIHALSQLSRGLEQRQDKRPMMSDLRESGSIEQDADIIQFLHREDYYDKETENQNMIEIIIAKQRDGGTGTVSLAFIKEYGKMVNIDWGQHQ